MIPRVGRISERTARASSISSCFLVAFETGTPSSSTATGRERLEDDDDVECDVSWKANRRTAHTRRRKQTNASNTHVAMYCAPSQVTFCMSQNLSRASWTSIESITVAASATHPRINRTTATGNTSAAIARYSDIIPRIVNRTARTHSPYRRRWFTIAHPPHSYTLGTAAVWFHELGPAFKKKKLEKSPC